MNTPRPSHDQRWEKLVNQARADFGPPIDLPALLLAVCPAPSVSHDGWLAEFSDLFSTRRTVPACLVGASALVLMAAWQIWTFWQALPWAEFILINGGGS